MSENASQTPLSRPDALGAVRHLTEVAFDRAGSKDVDQVIALMRAYYPEDHLQLDESAARSAVEQLVGDEKLGRIWLIRYDGRTVGYVVLAFGFSLEFHGRDAFVDELYVEPAYRGRGLGKAALRFVEAVAPALGITALHLEVERANTRAQTLYRRTGYEDHDRYLMTKWIRRNE